MTEPPPRDRRLERYAQTAHRIHDARLRSTRLRALIGGTAAYVAGLLHGLALVAIWSMPSDVALIWATVGAAVGLVVMLAALALTQTQG